MTWQRDPSHSSPNMPARGALAGEAEGLGVTGIGEGEPALPRALASRWTQSSCLATHSSLSCHPAGPGAQGHLPSPRAPSAPFSDFQGSPQILGLSPTRAAACLSCLCPSARKAAPLVAPRGGPLTREGLPPAAAPAGSPSLCLPSLLCGQIPRGVPSAEGGGEGSRGGQSVRWRREGSRGKGGGWGAQEEARMKLPVVLLPQLGFLKQPF